jgi:hypothetical protein
MDISVLFPESVASKAGKLASIIEYRSQCVEHIPDSFTGLIKAHSNSPHFLDLVIFAVSICHKICGEFLLPFIICLLGFQLFDARLSISTSDLSPASQIVLAVCSSAFEQMMREESTCFDTILRAKLSFSSAIVELLHFLKLTTGKVGPAFVKRMDFVKIISHASAVYQQRDIEGAYGQDGAETARVAIFLLITFLMYDINYICKPTETLFLVYVDACFVFV